MVVLYAGLVFGPPPPDDKAMAWAGISFLPLFIWAYWFDRHREAA
jgi:hypothetical protein